MSETADTMLNARIPTALKGSLVREAENKHVTASYLLKQLLEQRYTNNPDKEGVLKQVEDFSEGLQDFLEQTIELHAQRDKLAAMIEAKQGLFTDAPESLRNALLLCDRKISEISKQIVEQIPEEPSSGKSFLDFLDGLF